MVDVHAAIVRVEESRQSHVAWAVHLRECDHCQEYPPEYVQSAEEQDQIVAEYDNVLACLYALKRYDPTLKAMRLVLG